MHFPLPAHLRFKLATLMLVFLASGLPAFGAEGDQGAPRKALTFEELFGDEVIARGPGLEIKQSQLDQAFLAYRANLAARGRRFPESEREVKEAQLLDRMITTFLLTNRATRIDQTLADGQASRFFDDTKNSAGSEEDFLRQLRLTGLTPELFRQRVFEQSLAELVLERELADQTTVTDQEIKSFYETGEGALVRVMREEVAKAEKDPATDPAELAKAKDQIELVRKRNLETLTEPEKVRVSHVLISTRVPNSDEQLPDEARAERRRLAEQVLREAKGGADFDELIKTYSGDRNLSETGGHYTLSREEPYAPEFKAACFSLQPGQISDLVTTVFGFHVIKLHEIIPARKLTLEEISPRIKKYLEQQKFRRAMSAHLRAIKDQAKVEILVPKYRLERYGLAGATGSLPEDE